MVSQIRALQSQRLVAIVKDIKALEEALTEEQHIPQPPARKAAPGPRHRVSMVSPRPPVAKTHQNYLRDRVQYLRSLPAEELREWRYSIVQSVSEREAEKVRAIMERRACQRTLPTASSWEASWQRAKQSRVTMVLDKQAVSEAHLTDVMKRHHVADRKRAQTLSPEELRYAGFSTLITLWKSLEAVPALIKLGNMWNVQGNNSLAEKYGQIWLKNTRARVHKRRLNDARRTIEGVCCRLIIKLRIRRRRRSADTVVHFLRVMKQSNHIARSVHMVVHRIAQIKKWWQLALVTRATRLSLAMKQWVVFSAQQSVVSARGRKKKAVLVKNSPIWLDTDVSVNVYLDAIKKVRDGVDAHTELEMLRALCSTWVATNMRANAVAWTAYDLAVEEYLRLKKHKLVLANFGGTGGKINTHAMVVRKGKRDRWRNFNISLANGQEQEDADTLNLSIPTRYASKYKRESVREGKTKYPKYTQPLSLCRPNLRYCMNHDELEEVTNNLAKITWAQDRRLCTLTA